jgi:hypothetical protein
LTASATCACKDAISPTLKRSTEDTTTAPRTSISADEHEAALKVIDHAIQVHGGKEALARASNLERDGSGVLARETPIPFTDHTVFALPVRARMDLQVAGTQLHFLVNGEHAWNNGTEMSNNEAKEMTEDLYLMWLMTLVPLEGNTVQSGTTPEITVDGRPAVGVRILADKHPEVRLYFDKETGLLVKAQRQSLQTGSPVQKEHFFSDHKEFDKIKMPTHELVFMNGNKIVDVTYKSWKIVEKLE